MAQIFAIINTAFTLAFRPLEGMRPEFALIIISGITGVLMLYLYKVMSNQPAIERVKNGIKACILEIQLYKTDMRVMLRALMRVFSKNLTYMKLLLVPSLLLVAVIAVVLLQCYPRFEYRPVKPGEGFLFKVGLNDWDKVSSTKIEVPDVLQVEAGPLTVPQLKEINWRLRAKSPGDYTISVESGQERQKMTLAVGGGLRGVSRTKGPSSLGNYVKNPAGTFLASGSAFSAISIYYPEREMHSKLLLGMNWIIYFFVVSFLVALLLKFIIKAH